METDPKPPTPPPEGRRRARRLALALLGVAQIAAFGSFAVQIDGLVGPQGIAPAENLLAIAEAYFAEQGESGWLTMPSLALVFGASPGALRAMCLGGVVCGLLLLLGRAPRWAALGGWALYLSVYHMGGPFLSFQWDILLLEASLVAVFYAPGGWHPRPATGEPEPPVAGVWLTRLLLFKLMLMSGAVKLTSGDPTWQDLTALDYHYWTQPLPHPLAWYAHNAPDWTRWLGVLGNHFAELFAPWLILLCPRGRRLVAWGVGVALILWWGAGALGAVHVACGALLTLALGWPDRHRSRWPAALIVTGLMLSIAGTGNYGFFHVLTLALAASLLHDADLARLTGWVADRLPPKLDAIGSRMRIGSDGGAIAPAWLRRVTLAAAAVILPISATQMALRLGGGPIGEAGRAQARGDASAAQSALAWFGVAGRKVVSEVRPFHSVNGYGLFARMTTKRYELIVEGTADGEAWQPYGFVYKPDHEADPLVFAGLHMPRLDWQMWFAALAPRCDARGWQVAFIERLLEGSPAVRGLLAQDPFGDSPPIAVRVRRVDTRFTTPDERAQTDAVWVFEPAGQWCPPLTIEAFEASRRPRDG